MTIQQEDLPMANVDDGLLDRDAQAAQAARVYRQRPDGNLEQGAIDAVKAVHEYEEGHMAPVTLAPGERMPQQSTTRAVIEAQQEQQRYLVRLGTIPDSPLYHGSPEEYAEANRIFIEED